MCNEKFAGFFGECDGIVFFALGRSAKVWEELQIEVD